MKFHPALYAVIFLIAAGSALTLVLSTDAEGQEWNQGTVLIEPDPADETTPAGSPLKAGQPGRDANFTLWVTNSHTEEQRIILTIADGPDWTMAVTGSVDLPAGERKRIDLYVSVPDIKMDPSETFPIRIEGVANLTGDKAFLIAVVELDAVIDHELIVIPNNVRDLTISVYPGQRTFIDISLTNLGNMNDHYAMKIMEHLTTWDIQFKEGGWDLERSLGHSETDDQFKTSIMIKVPSSATAGQVLELEVVSTSDVADTYGTGKLIDKLLIDLLVINGASINILPGEPLVEANGVFEAIFYASHSGVTDAVYEPSVTISKDGEEVQGWNVQITPEDAILLEVGDEIRTIRLLVDPLEGSYGEYRVILGGTSNMASITPGYIAVHLTPRRNLELGALTGGPFEMGKNLSVSTTVTNSGDIPEQVVLETEGVPDLYLIDVAPSMDLLVGADEEVYVTIDLIPMEGAGSEEFNITLNMKALTDDLSGEWNVVDTQVLPVSFRKLPNLKLMNLELPIQTIQETEEICLNVTVSNTGNIGVADAVVIIYEITFGLSNPEISRTTVSLEPGDVEQLCFIWNARPSARSIRASIMMPQGEDEITTDDNEIIEPIYVIRNRLDGDPGGSGDQGNVPAVTAVVGGVVIALAAGLLVFISSKDAIRYPLFIGLAPLYSKLKPEHLLNNRLRKRIYVYVQNHPGEHFRSILTHLDLTNGTLAHHLYTLEKESLIRSKRDGLYRRFYPAGYQIDESKVSLSAIQKRILEVVEDEPGLSQKDISLRLSLSNSTVNYNIKSLLDKGMIEVKKEGKSTSIFSIKNENN